MTFICWLTAQIHIYPPFTHSSTVPYVHKKHCRCIQYEWKWKACNSSPPRGTDDTTETKQKLRVWQSRGGVHVCVFVCAAGVGWAHPPPPPFPLPFCFFTTLQNSLLICCSVWGVWIVPTSITIITRGCEHSVPRALSPNGPLRQIRPSVYSFCVSPLPPLLFLKPCKQCDIARTPEPQSWLHLTLFSIVLLHFSAL